MAAASRPVVQSASENQISRIRCEGRSPRCDQHARSAADSAPSIVHQAWPLPGGEESKPKGVTTIATATEHLRFDRRQVGHWCKWRLQGATGMSPCQAGSCPHSVPGLGPRGSAGVSTRVCLPLALKSPVPGLPSVPMFCTSCHSVTHTLSVLGHDVSWWSSSCLE